VLLHEVKLPVVVEVAARLFVGRTRSFSVNDAKKIIATATSCAEYPDATLLAGGNLVAGRRDRARWHDREGGRGGLQRSPRKTDHPHHDHGWLTGPIMRAKSTEIRCSVCGKGSLVQKLIDHDVGALLDMKRVVVHNMPALVCSKCGSVNMYGGILDQIALLLAVSILQLQELDPAEVRYLRKLIGDTQGEFAERLGVVRATVNRWENSSEPVKGPDAYAIRSHAFFACASGVRLSRRSPRRSRLCSHAHVPNAAVTASKVQRFSRRCKTRRGMPGRARAP
jgi:YgiT-type zinc finger domain-containing protein